MVIIGLILVLSLLKTMHDFIQIIEGQTKLLVPKNSLDVKIPSHYPAFFNPLASLNRDLSIYLYNIFLDEYYNKKNTPITFADAFGGIGSRGLRVAVEVPKVSQIYINDINELAIAAAKESAILNHIHEKCFFSINEVCKFLISRPTERNKRFTIIDLDPFGSPSPFIDCVLRSIENEGLISITATDTAVLSGIYQTVCLRKYFGLSINNTYSNEVAIRLLISSIALIAARLGISLSPIFVNSNRHYFRVFLKISLSNSEANKVFDNLGYIRHCFKCGDRNLTYIYSQELCPRCRSKFNFAGKLWIGNLFNKNIISNLLKKYFLDDLKNDKKTKQIKQIFYTSLEELDHIPYYFSVDEIGSMLKVSPKKLNEIIEKIARSGYLASRTIFRSTGLKTNASMSEILSILKN
ncbi:MAG TPA: tRNA (guanine(10)-N(2))-dimethyltransferase [Nitrososphaeraceae archaeon]